MAAKRPIPAKKQGKSLGPEMNAAARAYVKRIVDEECDGNKTIAAGRFGIAQSTLSEFLNGGRGAGMKILQGVAKYKGVSIDRIVNSVTWENAQQAPNKLEIAILYLGETLSPETVRTARTRFAGQEDQREPLQWGKELARINAELIGDANMVTRLDARAARKKPTPEEPKRKSRPPASSRTPRRRVGT